MQEKTEPDRVRAPLSDADRMTVCLAMKQSVHDEVLDVVVERLGRALGLGAAPPRLTLHRDESCALINEGVIIEPRVNAWSGLNAPTTVRLMPEESPVLARIG